MKGFLIYVGLLSMPVLGPQARADCAVRVRPSVEVGAGPVWLANLLAPGPCPGLLRAAARIRLGSAPLPGSMRVLTGEQVRSWIERAARLAGMAVWANIPERVSLRRSGKRLSCEEITLRISTADSMGASRCSSAERIPAEAALSLMASRWDPGLEKWQGIARCTPPADCVPFRVQISRSVPTSVRTPAERRAIVVRPGQEVVVISDDDGIQISAHAICLDRGALGDLVRARIGSGGRVLETRVESAGVLRAGF